MPVLVDELNIRWPDGPATMTENERVLYDLWQATAAELWDLRDAQRRGTPLGGEWVSVQDTNAG